MVNDARLQDRWNSDQLQLPRLLAELIANIDWEANANVDLLKNLAESMDLTTDQVHELIERGQACWDRIKAQLAVEGPLTPRRGLWQTVYLFRMIGSRSIPEETFESEEVARARVAATNPKTHEVVPHKVALERWWEG